MICALTFVALTFLAYAAVADEASEERAWRERMQMRRSEAWHPADDGEPLPESVDIGGDTMVGR